MAPWIQLKSNLSKLDMNFDTSVFNFVCLASVFSVFENYLCSKSQCLPSAWRCDNIKDCEDAREQFK